MEIFKEKLDKIIWKKVKEMSKIINEIDGIRSIIVFCKIKNLNIN